MPIYDYSCKDCETSFDLKATLSEYEAGLDAQCPSCSSTDVKRVLTGVSFNMGGTSTRGTAAPASAPAPTGGCASGMCGF